LERNEFLVALHRFSPYELSSAARDGVDATRNSQMLVSEKDSLRPLADVSHLVHSLREVWNADAHAHVFKLAKTGQQLDRSKAQDQFFNIWESGMNSKPA
jgi:hypothetical protein